MQVGGQLAGAHLRRTRAGTDIAEIEESFRVAFLFLDDDSEHARQNILELVRALIGVGEVGSQHRVELNAPECPTTRLERMARPLRVMHDEGRGCGEHLAKSFLLLGAQFDGVDNERLVGGGEDKAGHVTTRRPRVPLDQHSER